MTIDFRFTQTKESEEGYQDILSRKVIPENAGSILCVDDEYSGVQWTLLYQAARNIKFNADQVMEIIKRKDITDSGIFLKREFYIVQANPFPHNNIYALRILYGNNTTVNNGDYIVVCKKTGLTASSKVPILQEKNKNLINDYYRETNTDEQVYKEFESTALHEIMRQVTTKEQIDYLFTIPEFRTLSNSLGNTPLKELLSTLILRYDLSKVSCENAIDNDLDGYVKGKQSNIISMYLKTETDRFSEGLSKIIRNSLEEKAKKSGNTSISSFLFMCEEVATMVRTISILPDKDIMDLILYTVKKICKESPDYWTNRITTDLTIELSNILDNRIIFGKELEEEIIKEIEHSNPIARKILQNTYHKKIYDKMAILSELATIWKKKPSDFIMDEME